MRATRLVVAIAAGCSSPRSLPAKPAAVAGDASAADASAAAASLDAGVAAVAAPSCAGADLDLHAIIKSDACLVHEDFSPLPNAIRVRVDPPLRARVGERAVGAIVLENTSAADLDVRLLRKCSVDSQIETDVFDRSGRRADDDGACGPGGGGCSGSTIAVRLSPHGRTSFPVEVGTDVMHCGVAARSMTPGTYRVTIRANFLDKPISAPLVIVK